MPLYVADLITCAMLAFIFIAFELGVRRSDWSIAPQPRAYSMLFLVLGVGALPFLVWGMYASTQPWSHEARAFALEVGVTTVLVYMGARRFIAGRYLRRRRAAASKTPEAAGGEG